MRQESAANFYARLSDVMDAGVTSLAKAGKDKKGASGKSQGARKKSGAAVPMDLS